MQRNTLRLLESEGFRVRVLEVRRHCLTKKGAGRGHGSHLSSEGVRQARHISKPDLFLGLDPTPGPPPPWLTGLCSQYAGLELHIEAGRYVVTYRGLSIAMKVEIEAQMPAALATAQTLNQVLSYLMLQAAPELAN